MSFGDIRATNSSNTINNYNRSNKNDIITSLSDSLQQFQKKCLSIKERVTDMRKRKPGPAEKNDLDMQIKQIRETEIKLKNQIDNELKLLDSKPRTEVVSKRSTLGKLQKDMERLKISVQAIVNESLLVKVNYDTREHDTFDRIGNGYSSKRPMDDDINQSNYNSYEKNSSTPLEQQKALMFKPVMQGQEVDDAIIEERERDIKKINQELAMVNEMMKDMAEIVVKQSGQIDEIHAATEVSHERAKAGLVQVKQAAAYQPSCIIS